MHRPRLRNKKRKLIVINVGICPQGNVPRTLQCHSIAQTIGKSPDSRSNARRVLHNLTAHLRAGIETSPMFQRRSVRRPWRAAPSFINEHCNFFSRGGDHLRSGESRFTFALGNPEISCGHRYCPPPLFILPPSNLAQKGESSL